MAYWKKNAKDESLKWFNEAVTPSRPNRLQAPELRRLWSEAAKLLNQPGPDTSVPPKVSPAAK